MSLMDLNIEWFRAINNLGIEHTFLNPVFVFFAEYLVYILAAAMVIYWFTRISSNRMMVIQAGLSFLLAEALGKAVGLLYSNPQPFAVLPDVNKLIDKAVGNSFPSDHTILFVSICVSFWLVRRKKNVLSYLWLLTAGCGAISRIGVGVHYPADVIVGALLAIASAVLVYWIVPRLRFIQSLLAMYERGEQRILPAKGRFRA
ncbi:undecaprenyl-diphosphatase [Paenibacillus marinisediminis]